MELTGRVENGVIVLRGSWFPPEGAEVTVLYRPPDAEVRAGEELYRVQLPLVRTGQPGTVNLSNARIEELLSADDVSA
jgi:hypothetical protein